MTILVVAFAVVAGTVYVTRQLPPLYRAEATLIVEPIDYEQAALGEIMPRSLQTSPDSGGRGQVEMEVYVVTTAPIIKELIKKLDLRDSKGELLKSIRTDGQFIPLLPFPSQAVRARQHENTDVLLLQGYARDPALAATLANTLADCYITNKETDARYQLKRALSFLDSQIVELRKVYLAKRKAIQDYQELTGIVNIDRETAAAIERLVNLKRLEQQYILSLEMAKAALGPLDRELRSVLSAQVVDDILVLPEITLPQQPLENLEAGKNTSLDGAREQIRQTAVTLTPLPPQEAADATLNDLLKQHLESRVESTRSAARVKAAGGMIAAERNSLQSLPEKMSSIVDFEPEIMLLQQRLGNLEVSKNTSPDGSAEHHQQVNQEMDAVREQIRQTAVTLTPLLPQGVADATSNDLLKQYLEAKIEITRSAVQIKTVNDMIAAQRVSLQSLPEKISLLGKLTLDADAAASTIREALELRGSLSVAAAMQVSHVRIQARAEVPINPCSPVLPLNVMLSLLGGLGLGVTIAAAKECFYDRVTEPSIAETLLGVRFLGRLPSIRKHMSRKIFGEDPRSPHVRAYRSLRNILWGTAPDQKCRTVAVVSAVPGEGRTTVCINSALSAVQEYSRVLIVDLDLQKPTLHKRFGMQQTPGLTDYLFEGSPWDEVIRSTDISNLEIMPAGNIPTDSGFVLRSQQFADLTNKLCREYDCVVFDTPPALIVNDVVLLASLVEKVLVVTRSGLTRERHLKALVRVLKGAGVSPTGTIMIGTSGHRSVGRLTAPAVLRKWFWRRTRK